MKRILLLLLLIFCIAKYYLAIEESDKTITQTEINKVVDEPVNSEPVNANAFIRKTVFLKHLNAYRRSLNLNPVVYDAEINRIAVLQLNDNYTKSKVFYPEGISYEERKASFHINSNKKIRNLSDRISFIGMDSNDEIGEICYGLESPTLVSDYNRHKSLYNLENADNELILLEIYKHSPSHNVILTNPNANRIGITYLTNSKKFYNTIVFMK
jgi:hypothetical protein